MPDPNIIIDHELGLSWFGICKNANSSIKRAFLRTRGLDPHNVHLSFYFNYASIEDVVSAGLWSFAIKRNPYTRLVSCWINKTGASWTKSGCRWGIKQGMIFSDFVHRVCLYPDEECTGWGQHWRSQVYDIELNGALVPDYIGSFENLSEAWEIVRSHCRKPLPDLTHDNRMPDIQNPWTHKLKKMVQKRYERDFELLGYDV